jgi:hypothetical protein
MQTPCASAARVQIGVLAQLRLSKLVARVQQQPTPMALEHHSIMWRRQLPQIGEMVITVYCEDKTAPVIKAPRSKANGHDFLWEMEVASIDGPIGDGQFQLVLVCEQVIPEGVDGHVPKKNALRVVGAVQCQPGGSQLESEAWVTDQWLELVKKETGMYHCADKGCRETYPKTERGLFSLWQHMRDMLMAGTHSYRDPKYARQINADYAARKAGTSQGSGFATKSQKQAHKRRAKKAAVVKEEQEDSGSGSGSNAETSNSEEGGRRRKKARQ